MEKSRAKNRAEKSKSKEIKITRIYDAPVKRVWEAWVDPEQVGKWWGPRGFTLTTRHKDVRVGGVWDYTMHGPDGTDYVNKTKFLEVEKYSRLVYDHGGNDDRPPLFRVTALFSEVGGKTKLEMSMALATPEEAEETRKFIKKAGGESTWDRLAEFLAPVDRFVFNRAFDAPLKDVFEAWTNPEILSKWLAPRGFQVNFIEADIRSGGSSFYSMSGGDPAQKMFGKIQYKEIVRDSKIRYVQCFSDEKGGIQRHPFSPTWPMFMRTTISFHEEGPDASRVTVEWEIEDDGVQVTEEERKTFHASKAGMTQGWTGSLDQLEEFLNRA